MTAEKKISRNGPSKKDGKKGPVDQLKNNKMTAKYTIERTKEDIKNLHEIDGILEYHLHKMYNTDSQRYRDLPKLTVILDEKVEDLQKANEELTAKLSQLEDLRTCFCRIFEICNIKME